jgi:hypothetical protein
LDKDNGFVFGTLADIDFASHFQYSALANGNRVGRNRSEEAGDSAIKGEGSLVHFHYDRTDVTDLNIVEEFLNTVSVARLDGSTIASVLETAPDRNFNIATDGRWRNTHRILVVIIIVVPFQKALPEVFVFDR